MSLSVFRKSSDLYSANGAMNRTNGFTLIEVLIAVLVLAVGLLGLAGLQVTSLGNSQSAYNRSVATQLAYDLADRMRANITIANPNYPNPPTQATLTTSAYIVGSATQVNTCNTTSGCTPEQMAQNDLFDWNTDVAASLPSGSGIICVDSTPEDGTATASACDGIGSSLTVKIWWDDDKSGANQRFEVSFQL